MRLIDADALIRELNNSHFPGAPYVDAGISIAIGKVCDAPTIGPERKKGRWIYKNNLRQFVCSECEFPSLTYDDRYVYSMDFPNYCEDCGADMRGKKE